MNKSRIDSIINAIRAIEPDDVWLGSPVDKSTIAQVEKELNIKFCSDYVEYLETYGDIWVDDEQLSGLSKEYPDATSGGDVRYETAQFESSTGIKLQDRTVLHNADGEFYLIIDHAKGTVLTYDPFAGCFSGYADNLEEALVKFLSKF